MWTRLRTFIPSETAGLVVFLIGVIIGLAALRVLVGEGDRRARCPAAMPSIAGLALAVMIGLNIWNKGQLRLFCILIGMVVGYVAAAATGLLTRRRFPESVLRQPLVALPTIAHVSFAFDPELIIPFAVTGLAAAMGATAVIATYQRTTDADWVRPEMNSIRGGIFADGIAAVGCRLARHLRADGVDRECRPGGGDRRRQPAHRLRRRGDPRGRRVQPGFVAVLTIMPPPVMASALLFTAVFIMISGVQIISTRVLDARRTLVIGMGMMAFFVVSVFPGGVRRRAALAAAAGELAAGARRRWSRSRSISCSGSASGAR